MISDIASEPNIKNRMEPNIEVQVWFYLKKKHHDFLKYISLNSLNQQGRGIVM